MTRFMQFRLVLATVGIVVWGYGLARDDANVRLAGIIVLAASLILRFAPRTLRNQAAREPPPSPDA